MTPKTDIWMALYVGDFLKSTLALNTRQVGAYMLLRMEYWQRQGSLPDDDEELAVITRMTLKDWLKDRPKLTRYFEIKNGQWILHDLEFELVRAKKNRDLAVEKGRRGAESRYGTSHSPSHSPGHSQGDGDGHTPSPSPSQGTNNVTPETLTFTGGGPAPSPRFAPPLREGERITLDRRLKARSSALRDVEERLESLIETGVPIPSEDRSVWRSLQAEVKELEARLA